MNAPKGKTPVFAVQDGQVVELTKQWQPCRCCGTWNHVSKMRCVNNCEERWEMIGKPNQPVAEQIERWDRVATANPESFAAKLKAFWSEQEKKEWRQKESTGFVWPNPQLGKKNPFYKDEK